MKLLQIKLLILCAFAAFSFMSMRAQVTIGAGEAPEKYALLQLKDKTGTSLDAATGEKGGLLLPRVELKKKKELLPFATDAEVASPTQEYRDAKLSHTGLVVYNLVENEDEDLCRGINQWDGEQWNCLQNRMGIAKFDPVSCADITPHGTYVEGIPASAENYLSINLNVTRTGTFAITATTGNGYNFYLSGVALSEEEPMTVNVPCQGIPVNVQTDKLVFEGITSNTGCEPEIEVSPAMAKYSLNCSNIEVKGIYEKGVALNSTNMITLNVTVKTAGSYTINTPLTNGIRFSAAGNFTTGTHTVTLYGSGTPTVNLDFPITVNANTREGNSSCSTTIPVILPVMTYAEIGSTSSPYSWATSARVAALTGGASFGPAGIVKMEGFSQLWQASDDSETAVNILLSELFGSSVAAEGQIAGTPTTEDNDYQIANLPDDPIINGPFGNLSGRYWGEDNASAGSVVVTSLPANSVQICSAYNPFGKADVNPDYSVVWHNDSKNFVYFGDSAGAAVNTDRYAYPAYYSSAGLPASKYYGNSGISTSQYVYNAALELNSVAWALKKAAVSGINPH